MLFKIKKLRLERKMSQKQLCELAGISRQTLSDLENGKDVNTTTYTLEKIAKALDCSLHDILCL